MTMEERFDSLVASIRDLSQRRDDSAEIVARLIEADPHQWSTRPCPTCRTITAVLGRPFGCNATLAARAPR